MSKPIVGDRIRINNTAREFFRGKEGIVSEIGDGPWGYRVVDVNGYWVENFKDTEIEVQKSSVVRSG
jgi:hypothetical protein